MVMSVSELYQLDGRVVIITGGAGLLGERHGEAVAEAGGIPVLVDVLGDRAIEKAKILSEKYDVPALGFPVDVTNKASLLEIRKKCVDRFGHIDVLINNAANNPNVSKQTDNLMERFENFSTHVWDEDIRVGLTGTFLCCQVFGEQMVKQDKGVIINISSDLGLIAPDQRLYEKEGVDPQHQPVKPVSYSIIKHGLIGLTRYLATYWASHHIRVNALAPGGVRVDQSDVFVNRISSLIPMGRMAHADEYKGAIVFLASDASSYMTGATLVIDGGRTCW